LVCLKFCSSNSKFEAQAAIDRDDNFQTLLLRLYQNHPPSCLPLKVHFRSSSQSETPFFLVPALNLSYPAAKGKGHKSLVSLFWEI
jgi:hypothetical protein